MLAIRLPEDIETRLNSLAHVSGRSKSSLAREAIIACLGDFEDSAIAEKRLTAYREGRSQSHTLDEAISRLGLEDQPE